MPRPRKEAHTAGNIQKVDTRFLQNDRCSHRVFFRGAPRQIIRATEADRKGHVLPDLFPDRGNRLKKEPQAVLETAAVLVRPLVGHRRVELVQKVCVRAVDLDAVIAGFQRAHRRFRVGAGQLPDLLHLELPRLCLEELRGDVHRTCGYRLVDSIAAGMIKLNKSKTPTLMDRIREKAMFGDLLIRHDKKLLFRGAPAVSNAAVFRNDDARRALHCPVPVIPDKFIRDVPLVRLTRLHRRHNEAVLRGSCSDSDLL